MKASHEEQNYICSPVSEQMLLLLLSLYYQHHHPHPHPHHRLYNHPLQSVSRNSSTVGFSQYHLPHNIHRSFFASVCFSLGRSRLCMFKHLLRTFCVVYQKSLEYSSDPFKLRLITPKRINRFFEINGSGFKGRHGSRNNGNSDSGQRKG